MTTIFWPRDVVQEGYFYGWTKYRTVCVAGVLNIDTRADADAVLAKAVRSEDVQALTESCGTPFVLGYSTLPSTRPLALPNIEDEALNASLMNPYRFIYYHRHAMDSRRFYAAENDMADLSLVDNDLKTPMEASIAHDFTRNKSVQVPDYQLIINQWNAAKSLQEAVERSRARISEPNEAQCTDRSLEQLHAQSKQSSLPGLFGMLLGSLSKLKETSFAVRQIEGRAGVLHQLTQWKHVERNRPIAASSHSYNRHYNSVWVILNDVIIGLAFRQFMCQNRGALNAMIADGLESALVHRVQRVLLWLDSWPAGLKLNTELSRFYTNGFMGLIAQWTKLLHYGLSFLPAISFLVETTSLLGMTMTLSLSLDLVSLLTAHLHACYLVSSTIYRRVLMLVGSLWNLFRGKRYNTLRNRTDRWDYDVDQLLLGTILFTLAAHLFPTILVYYALFALVRLLLIVLYASCETLLAFMNHFPLFALMLRSKDPERLPGEAYLQVKPTPTGCAVTVEVGQFLCELACCLLSQSHPVPFTVVFAQYGELWHRLTQHYHPIRLGRRLLQGQVLDTFPHASLKPALNH
ncbi:Gpi1-domain-containing protein [Gyrodon lividus]|nr:Gpi1-domain-containing protein [Gyrodon lividus]